jgi:dTMP kinase
MWQEILFHSLSTGGSGPPEVLLPLAGGRYTGAVREGRFIVLEGPDGSGKSTQASLLVEALRGRGRETEHLRDPGGTEVGDRIREILLHAPSLEASVETFLFLASRAQLVVERIRPALAAGRWVVCERFTMSTVVYQGRAAEPPLEGALLEALRTTIAGSAVGVAPDLVLVLDVDPATGLARKAGPGGLDRIERKGEPYQEMVRAGYLEEARLDGRAAVLPPGSPEETRARVMAAVEGLLGER